jgi:hypothetical protein
VDSEGPGGAWQVVQGRVALAEGGHLVHVADDGQEVAEAPDAGLVDGLGGSSTLLPEPAESAGIG